MSKKANHWYLLGATVQAWTKLFRPRARQIALWLALVALFFVLGHLDFFGAGEVGRDGIF